MQDLGCSFTNFNRIVSLANGKMYFDSPMILGLQELESKNSPAKLGFVFVLWRWERTSSPASGSINLVS